MVLLHARGKEQGGGGEEKSFQKSRVPFSFSLDFLMTDVTYESFTT